MSPGEIKRSAEGVKRLPHLFRKIRKVRGNIYRLPVHEGLRSCEEGDLTWTAKGDFTMEVQHARSLGYTDCRFYTSREKLDPSVEEAFTFLALHNDRTRVLSIDYSKATDAKGVLEHKVVITGGLRSKEWVDIGFIDQPFFLDGPPGSKCLVVEQSGLVAIDQAMQFYMAAHEVDPFDNFDAMKRWADENEVKRHDDHIRRGLLVPVDKLSASA